MQKQTGSRRYPFLVPSNAIGLDIARAWGHDICAAWPEDGVVKVFRLYPDGKRFFLHGRAASTKLRP